MIGSTSKIYSKEQTIDDKILSQKKSTSSIKKKDKVKFTLPNLTKIRYNKINRNLVRHTESINIENIQQLPNILNPSKSYQPKKQESLQSRHKTSFYQSKITKKRSNLSHNNSAKLTQPNNKFTSNNQIKALDLSTNKSRRKVQSCKVYLKNDLKYYQKIKTLQNLETEFNKNASGSISKKYIHRQNNHNIQDQDHMYDNQFFNYQTIQTPKKSHKNNSPEKALMRGLKIAQLKQKKSKKVCNNSSNIHNYKYEQKQDKSSHLLKLTPSHYQQQKSSIFNCVDGFTTFGPDLQQI